MQWARALPEARFGIIQREFPIGATEGERPVLLKAASVDAGFFHSLGQQPIRGGFTPAHFEPSAGLVPAMISFDLWRREFGADEHVIGRRLNLVGTVNQIRAPLPGVQVAGVSGVRLSERGRGGD
jgi:hypothetical protein